MKLTLSVNAHEQLRQICTLHRGLEVGGLLVGTRDSDRAFVWEIIGPGPGAVLHARTLVLDTSFMVGVLVGVAAAGTVEVLGRWHKHIAPDLRASHDDRRGADAFRMLTRVDESFELIIGTDRDFPIGFGAYLCTSEGLCRIPMSSPNLLPAVPR